MGETNVISSDEHESDPVVKSAGRVLKILELFDILRREAPVSEVSSLLHMPQSSTSILLRSMVVLGYLQFNPESRMFKPTTRVALLGSWINGPMISDGRLMQLMERINARTSMSVVLAARNRVWSEYIHVVQSPNPVRLFMVKGSRRPLVRSGTGLALLAGLSDPEIKRIVIRTNDEAGRNGQQVGISTLMEQVVQTRQNGWAFTFDTITKGGGMIAMRLPMLENNEELVLGLAGRTQQLKDNLEEYLTVMREEIARKLA
ncbi:hypothetical protein A7X12_14065 [Sphingomonas sp. TDK1]|nr:hypothetical protein A7X12_14065 [Sphingomonas sp. TDK1]